MTIACLSPLPKQLFTAACCLLWLTPLFAQQSSTINYNAASWITDLLLPQKATLTLKDIVIPGAHDAGMSVLSATGGIQRSTINECNTLTQLYPVGQQLEMGIRMFDLRVGILNEKLYTKHCSSNCMEEAIGGGYGESLPAIVNSLRSFLEKHSKEFILISFTHFCDKEISAPQLGEWLRDSLGKEWIFDPSPYKNIGEIPLHQLSGKVLLAFENYNAAALRVSSCSFDSSSNTFVNFNRAYAATNNAKTLVAREKQFFNQLNNHVNANDLVRLDWQLTQTSDEAAMVCNDFQSQRTGLALDMTMLLTNLIRGHKSILTLSHKNNQRLTSAISNWIADNTINRYNKPNILFVDVAGQWITDYCIQLNQHALYQAK